jgi:isoleucyl-tRNA synthetase
LAAYEAYEFHVVYQKISQFVAVELSAIYHDVVKDRLYTDAANSPRRRSTQTALYQMVTGLCQMLAPILVFTTDEAWEYVPGQSLVTSVHLSEWCPKRFKAREAEQALWCILFQVREAVLPELEKARQTKTIGKALEAKLKLSGKLTFNQDAQAVESLRELLNVSQLELVSTDTEAWQVEVFPADGQKCERCWHWEPTVGSHSEHQTICNRCVSAINM